MAAELDPIQSDTGPLTAIGQVARDRASRARNLAVCFVDPKGRDLGTMEAFEATLLAKGLEVRLGDNHVRKVVSWAIEVGSDRTTRVRIVLEQWRPANDELEFKVALACLVATLIPAVIIFSNPLFAKACLGYILEPLVGFGTVIATAGFGPLIATRLLGKGFAGRVAGWAIGICGVLVGVAVAVAIAPSPSGPTAWPQAYADYVDHALSVYEQGWALVKGSGVAIALGAIIGFVVKGWDIVKAFSSEKE